MITYNPVPGKIYDIATIATLLSDYDGYIEFLKSRSPKLEDTTLEIYSFIRKYDISFDNDIKFAFCMNNGSKFLGDFLTNTEAYYTFDSTYSFIMWVRNLGLNMLLPSVIEYLKQFTDETNELHVNEFSTPKEIYSFVSSLKLSEKWKLAVLSIFLDTATFATKLADAMVRCEALLNDINLKFHKYIKSIEDRCYDVADLQRITTLRSVTLDIAKLEDAVYSFTFLNDGIVFYMNVSGSTRFLLGSNVEAVWHDNTSFEAVSVELLGKAVGDGKRLQILKLLENKTMYATELAKTLDIAHTSLFYHMNLLVDSGLVKVSLKGRKTYYVLNVERIKEVGCFLVDYYNELTKKEVN